MIASIAADRALQQILRLLPTLSTILSRCTRKKITSFVLHAHADAVEIVHSQQSGSPPTVHAAANVFQRFCYENKDALSAGIIVAGWDKEIGPSVYNIPLGGGLFRQPWAIGGVLSR